MNIVPAASVLLTRGPESPLVYLVHRSPQLRFFGDFWAFPGGKLCPEDNVLAERLFPQSDPRLVARQLAGARELFEETGILIARQSDGSFPD